ncbi:MAG: UDP-N-acetylmuramoyl-tripeptide--D-alanyl-D-alanine ligase [Chloroflexota bacterium]
MLTFADVLEALTDQRFPYEDQLITEAVIDSRCAIPGSIFIALPGERVDGHDFVGNAFNLGASFALVDKDLSDSFNQIDLRGKLTPDQLGEISQPVCLLVENSLEALQRIAGFWRAQLDLEVIGITGSVGKSTTKEMIAEVISRKYPTLKNEGNFNNEIGLPLTVLGLTKGHRRAVLEMGFYVPGEIKFLCEIARPRIGVVTNIGTVHAERAGSQKEIAAGKAELVRALPKDGFAILNYDDPLVRQMAEETQAAVLFYGMSPEADLWADQVEGLGLEGIRFRLHYKNEVIHLRVPMLGQHSVQTALRAAAVGLVEGLGWQEIVSGLRFGHMQLRLMAVRSDEGALLLDDTYNASPQSTLAALNLLAELDGRKVAVLGDMLELGQYEEQGHQKVGIRAAEVADFLITVGQRAHLIASSAKASGMPEELIIEVEETTQAIEVLREQLNAEDVVLIKGSRGMRMDAISPALEKVQ